MKIRWFYLSLALLLMPCTAVANTASTEHVEAELISETQHVKPGEPFWLAVRLQMIPQWHTYWKNPGDAGLDTRIHWDLPAGFTAGPIQWPYPERIKLGELANYGYEGEAILLTEVATPGEYAGREVVVDAKVEWLVCKEICIPEAVNLSLTLPVSDQNSSMDPDQVKIFDLARSKIPKHANSWQVRAAFHKDKLLLYAVAKDPGLEVPKAVEFFAENQQLIEYASDQDFQSVPGGFMIRIERSENDIDWETVRGVLVSKVGFLGPDSGKAIAFEAALEPYSSWWANLPQKKDPFLGYILFAFLGGLLLNLMPCVFPVLSIKVLALIHHASQSRSQANIHGWVFGSGVIASFWVLAGLLFVFRAGGQALGWGFQLQSPLFIYFLVLVFGLLTLNLWGFFEWRTPGVQVKTRTGYANSFGNGVLATIVATPCTAPFMGAALGFAVTQSNFRAWLIFTALGFGMASPYILLASQPRLLQFLPKPGTWMVRFKELMGLILLATVGWLIWVLSSQISQSQLKIAVSSLGLAGLGAMIWGRLKQKIVGSKTKVVLGSLFIISLALLAAVFSQIIPQGTKIEAQQETAALTKWNNFDASYVQELREARKSFFIDYTARWCLTCQVNERWVLNQTEIQQAFKDSGLILIRADWTQRNDEITKSLESYGRSGVPTYVIDRGGDFVILPEILTPGVVIQALEDIEE